MIVDKVSRVALIYRIFRLLEDKCQANKKEAFTKETHRETFLEKIINAKSNISLYGLKYPKYITTPNHKIVSAFEALNSKLQQKISIDIYVPSRKMIDHINTLNIYPNQDLDVGNIEAIKNTNDRLTNLDIRVYEYLKFTGFGASAIDVGENNSFLHISQITGKENIENAPYFDIDKSMDNKNIFELLVRVFEDVKKKSKIL